MLPVKVEMEQGEEQGSSLLGLPAAVGPAADAAPVVESTSTTNFLPSSTGASSSATAAPCSGDPLNLPTPSSSIGSTPSSAAAECTPTPPPGRLLTSRIFSSHSSLPNPLLCHHRSRVLVTGGNGLLASHVLHQLLDSGYYVKCTVRGNPGGGMMRRHHAFLHRLHRRQQQEASTHQQHNLFTTEKWLNPTQPPQLAHHTTTTTSSSSILTIHQVDLGATDQQKAMSQLVPLLADVFCVMHIASPCYFTSSNKIVDDALRLTETVMKSCIIARVPKVVFTSSIYAVLHGHVPYLYTPVQQWKPNEAAYVFSEHDWSVQANVCSYSLSKLMSEKCAVQLARRSEEMELTCLCVANIYGPALSGHHAHNMFGSNGRVVSLLMGLCPLIPPLGDVFVDVRDAAEAHLRAMQRATGKRIERFVVAGSPGQPVSKLVEWINAAVEPMDLRCRCVRMSPGFLSSTLAKLDLPWPSVSRNMHTMGQHGLVATVDGTKAERDLHLSYRPPVASLRSHVLSCVMFGSIACDNAAGGQLARRQHVYPHYRLHPLGGLIYDSNDEELPKENKEGRTAADQRQ